MLERFVFVQLFGQGVSYRCSYLLTQGIERHGGTSTNAKKGAIERKRETRSIENLA